MEHVADRPGDDIRITLEDKGTAVRALVQADDAGDLEAAQGFAHGGPADPELQGQLTFRRQLVAWAQRSCGHLAANLFADFLENALGANRCEAWLRPVLRSRVGNFGGGPPRGGGLFCPRQRRCGDRRLPGHGLVHLGARADVCALIPYTNLTGMDSRTERS